MRLHNPMHWALLSEGEPFIKLKQIGAKLFPAQCLSDAVCVTRTSLSSRYTPEVHLCCRAATAKPPLA
ncbi:hypothetical protein M404DRAFT_995773 [Pisolithus tinctorius Marx 270]|uniref:Uncharacterized protein n=1 Tax=Pisolithus tinctorius Marx 270 TaxID=870435 RepID=A0A0C3JN00_PISTI|nr:hypothetical protein M404DRAFT_995773 [Pisolithus tinctorius Marx 270]